RREDIPELARHFLARFAAEEGRRVSRIGADAMTLLCGHDWPGNVRQLENAMFRAVVLVEGDTISANEFPQLGGNGVPAHFSAGTVEAEADARAAPAEAEFAPALVPAAGEVPPMAAPASAGEPDASLPF